MDGPTKRVSTRKEHATKAQRLGTRTFDRGDATVDPADHSPGDNARDRGSDADG